MIRTKSPLLLAAAGLIALTACTDPSVQTADPNQRTKEGAVVGGILGALAGIATGDDAGERRRGALIGGAIGAGAGAVIGNNLDRQAEELRQSMDSRVAIINEGNRLVVRMPNGILFAIDSAAVTGALESDLRVLAQSLRNYPNTTVQVIGHTDNTGEAAYNQDLSARRAASVTAVLVGAGVAPSRIQSFGRGEDQPIATNLTEAGRAQNRRVEVIILPNA